ncbi:TIGR02391 family protein [Mycolicibacterium canariasense]|uniref:TIGR02391 family protein n=1 Tax=Mycolicibacterium canariasense TaxID=228230 RepID=UPI0032D580AD
MTAIDYDWAITSLQEFMRSTDQVGYNNCPGSGVVMLGAHQRAADAGIRNPFNHEGHMDIDEQRALEYLAALSVLARWVDDAEVETAP